MNHDLVIETIGGACPVQGYGTLDGELFYFRFRMNSAQLYVGPPDVSNDDGDMPAHPPRLYAEINDVFDGEPYLGVLDDGEARELLDRLVGMLRPYEEYQEGTRRDRLARWLKRLDQILQEDGADRIRRRPRKS